MIDSNDSSVHLSDQQVIGQILSSQTELFSILVERYQQKIFSYTLRLLNYNQQDAEDAAANAFLKAYISLASYNSSLKFSSWLYRIAHNEAVNLIRKNSQYYTADTAHLDIAQDFDFDKPNKIDLEKILAKLSEDYKNILTLFYLEELSLEEISEILKISTNAVAVRLNRARNKARQLIKP